MHDENLTPLQTSERLYEAWRTAMATGDFTEAAEYIHPDAIDHRGGTAGDFHGRDAWLTKWQEMSTGDGEYADWAVTVEHTIQSDDAIGHLYTTTGTDRATGKPFKVHSMDLAVFRDGRIVEHWAFFDRDAVKAQTAA